MKNSTILLVIVVLAVIAGLLYTFIQTLDKVTIDNGNIVCTADAMQCPDGSYVGRSGANCEFVCPAATTTATTTPPAAGGGGGGFAEYHSGIRGTVMAGPTCPVERDPPDPKCADRPISTTVAVFRANNPTTPFAIGKSDAQGTFEFSLPPGSYVVGAGESQLPRCTQTPAAVGPNAYTTIVVECDTGIR